MFITEAVAPVVWTIDTAGNGRKNYRRIAWSIKDGHDWISDGIAGWWAAIRYGQPLGRWLNPDFSGWRRPETLDPDCRRNIVGEFSRRCERAGELRSDTARTGAHRLLPRPKSVLSGTIGSCRCQSACAIRRRVVSGNYRNRPSETQTTSATIKAQTIPARPAGDRKNFDHAPPTFDLISPNAWATTIAKPLKIGRASVYRALAA